MFIGFFFPKQHHRENRRSLAIFDHGDIVHLGASMIFVWGTMKIAAVTAEVRAMFVHSAQERNKSTKFYFVQANFSAPLSPSRIPAFC